MVRQERKPGAGTCRPERAALIAACVLGSASAHAETGGGAAPASLPEVAVVAPSPLPGSSVKRDTFPTTVETVAAPDFARTFSFSATEALVQQVPGVSLSDVQGNVLAPDLHFRGFTASPLQGTPQGLAVYQNGVRINEAFGDTVNWEFIPPIAIARADVFSSNPLFGLNALGGAVSLTMKNGFTHEGARVEVQGGSFGRFGGTLEYGRQKDEWGVYVAADGLHDEGWRLHSPSDVARLYADLGWKGANAEWHMTAAAASNALGVVGPTPVDLLRQDYRAVYTWPQTTRNDMGLLALRGAVTLEDGWSVEANAYLRGFAQRHVDGNGADVERCSRASAFATSVCLQDDGFPRPNPVTPDFRNQFVVLDSAGKPIPFAASSVAYGTIDRTRTDAFTTGGALQLNRNGPVFGLDNHFTAGASVDASRVAFAAHSTLGAIFPDLSVRPDPAVAGMGQVIHTLGEVGYAPVGVAAQNVYTGVFATDTLALTPDLAATLGGRFNVARIDMADTLGTSPALTGRHEFSRFNPAAGLSYKLLPDVTVYGGYAENNRAPTPLELGCADPLRPCLLAGFLVADPPLRQVVSRSVEGGLRGTLGGNGGSLDWKLGAFRTRSEDDIISLASAIQGRGYFANVPATLRQGIEAGVRGRAGAWLAYANYSFVDATYRFTGDLASPNNPSADENGLIHVMPGNRIPGIPRHQLKLGADYAATAQWTIGGDVLAVGSQRFVGDDANQNPALPAYWIANLHTTYQVTPHVQLFALVNNLFDRRYATYGTYFSPEAVAKAITTPLADRRMVTPGQPLSIYVGLRARL